MDADFIYSSEWRAHVENVYEGWRILILIVNYSDEILAASERTQTNKWSRGDLLVRFTGYIERFVLRMAHNDRICNVRVEGARLYSTMLSNF